MLNYGWAYATMWRLVKRVLPEESISRIFFPTQEELLEYFDEDKIFIGNVLRELIPDLIVYNDFVTVSILTLISYRTRRQRCN